jgi:hypothetical protein
MSDLEQPDKEPSTAPQPGASVAYKGRRAFDRVQREIDDSDLATPAVGRMLIADVERLERETALLVDFRDKYFAARESLATYRERERKSRSGEIIFGGCLALGGAAMGYAPVAWSHQPNGIFSLVFGAILMIIGMWSRVAMR